MTLTSTPRLDLRNNELAGLEAELGLLPRLKWVGLGPPPPRRGRPPLPGLRVSHTRPTRDGCVDGRARGALTRRNRRSRAPGGGRGQPAARAPPRARRRAVLRAAQGADEGGRPSVAAIVSTVRIPGMNENG
jgi:hypothetical protein